MTTEKCSKIKLTVTAEHYQAIAAHYQAIAEQRGIWMDGKPTDRKLDPLTLEFDMPNPWRTDIENAPKDGRAILIWSDDEIYVVVPLDYSDEYQWENEYDVFRNREITNWMEIPKLPKP